MEEYIQDLAARLTAIVAENAALRAAQSASVSQPPPAITHLEPNVPLPARFSGNRKDVRGFINQLELVESLPLLMKRIAMDWRLLLCINLISFAWLISPPMMESAPYSTHRSKHPPI